MPLAASAVNRDWGGVTAAPVARLSSRGGRRRFPPCPWSCAPLGREPERRLEPPMSPRPFADPPDRRCKLFLVLCSAPVPGHGRRGARGRNPRGPNAPPRGGPPGRRGGGDPARPGPRPFRPRPNGLGAPMPGGFLLASHRTWTPAWPPCPTSPHAWRRTRRPAAARGRPGKAPAGGSRPWSWPRCPEPGGRDPAPDGRRAAGHRGRDPGPGGGDHPPQQHHNHHGPAGRPGGHHRVRRSLRTERRGHPGRNRHRDPFRLRHDHHGRPTTVNTPSGQTRSPAPRDKAPRSPGPRPRPDRLRCHHQGPGRRRGHRPEPRPDRP